MSKWESAYYFVLTQMTRHLAKIGLSSSFKAKQRKFVKISMAEFCVTYGQRKVSLVTRYLRTQRYSGPKLKLARAMASYALSCLTTPVKFSFMLMQWKVQNRMQLPVFESIWIRITKLMIGKCCKDGNNKWMRAKFTFTNMRKSKGGSSAALFD